MDIPGVHLSEQDASQLLRWRQRSSLTHAATPPASCFIDRARVCGGPNAFPSVTGSNTRSTCRFRALITPILANMVGPPRSATSMSASIAACHSGRSDSSLADWLCGSPRLAASAASGHSPTRSDHRSGRPGTLTIAHRRDWILIPVKVRPDVGAPLLPQALHTNRASRSESRT